MLVAVIPLIFTFYYGILITAVFLFPQSYDSRFSVISNLLAPQHNPEFHWLASLGMALAGLFAVPFGGYIGCRLRPVSRLWANIGASALIGGFVLLILAAVIETGRLHPIFGMLGVHELLARTSAIGLGIGIVCFYGCVLRGTRSIGRHGYGRGLVFLWSVITLSALVAVAGSLCTVLPSKAGVPGLLPVYRPLRQSPVWHLAFWEWIGSGAVFLFLISAAWLLPEGDRLKSRNSPATLSPMTDAGGTHRTQKKISRQGFPLRKSFRLRRRIFWALMRPTLRRSSRQPRTQRM